MLVCVSVVFSMVYVVLYEKISVSYKHTFRQNPALISIPK